MSHKHKAHKEAPAEKEQGMIPDETAPLRQELAESNERYLRTLADFDNTRKRLLREKEEFSRFASEAIVRELLPILDSLDQAIAGSSDSDPNLVSGLKLIEAQAGVEAFILRREWGKWVAHTSSSFPELKKLSAQRISE